MLHFVETSWGEGQRLRATAFAGLATLASLICLQAVLDRVSSAYDGKIQSKQSENLARVEGRKALDTLEAAVKADEAAAAAECASGRGPKCKGAEDRAEAARRRVKDARNELVQLGAAIVEDPAAKRLAAILPWSEAQIALATPLMLPVWLELSGLVLLTYGLAPRRKPKRKVAVKKSRKKKAPPKKPSSPQPAKVVARPAPRVVGE
jgi:hypothetical protein